MEDERPPEAPDQAEQAPETRRVYPPAEVQARLEVSASGLRRLAGIYERAVGPLPRDERGRVWPEEAVDELERARALVRDQRAVSIEAALRGQDAPHDASGAPVEGDLAQGHREPLAAILDELRKLRELVEEQNRRIAELEGTVRTGRELESPRDEPHAPEPASDSPEGADTPEPAAGPEAATPRRERSWWRRFFGF